jgi:transposase
MAMGTRARRERQEPLWIAQAALPRGSGHPFYERLNELLEQAQFDTFVEGQCRQYYAAKMGRPGLPPGIYFRLLLLGYFEGMDSERGIAWRAEDSLSVRRFLGLALDEAAPDHSTISRTRRLIAVETHQEVFGWVLRALARAGLVQGKTLGIDATTVEANAALRSIVRRDNGERYEEFLTRLAQESGIPTPTREDLARLDRQRPKKGSNQEWQHPHDPDARITKMKDGRTHLAHKLEHAVDLETGALLGVTVHGADQGDTTTVLATLIEAAEQVEELQKDETAQEQMPVSGIQEVVADKGYHSNQVLLDLEAVGLRTYISEPDRGRRRWQECPEAQAAVYGNRRRIRGARGRALLRRRGEFLERPFAHQLETGGMRRVHLRGRPNILKRYLLQAAACNLGLLMRSLFGVGTPRSLQGQASAILCVFWVLLAWWYEAPKALSSFPVVTTPPRRLFDQVAVEPCVA